MELDWVPCPSKGACPVCGKSLVCTACASGTTNYPRDAERCPQGCYYHIVRYGVATWEIGGREWTYYYTTSVDGQVKCQLSRRAWIEELRARNAANG